MALSYTHLRSVPRCPGKTISIFKQKCPVSTLIDQVGIEQPEHGEPLLNRSVRQATVLALQAG